VLIILAVRRFRCPDRSCAKATFAEQAEDLSVRYRRRSVPLLGMLAADAKKLTKAPVYGMAFDATADEQSTWQL
jgi:hypothetical protein